MKDKKNFKQKTDFNDLSLFVLKEKVLIGKDKDSFLLFKYQTKEHQRYSISKRTTLESNNLMDIHI